MMTTFPSTSLRKSADNWIEALAGHDLTIALTDGDDPRTVAAAAALHAEGVVRPRLIGSPERIAATCSVEGVELPDDVVSDTADLGTDDRIRTRIASRFASDLGALASALTDPIAMATAAVGAGVLDGAVGGATRRPADVLRAAMRFVEPSCRTRILSNSILLALPDGRCMTFADSAVLPVPSADQLAEIAEQAADIHLTLTGVAPTVAMLSAPSDAGEHVHRVSTAVEILRGRRPNLSVSQDLRSDTAVVEAIATATAPRSLVAGPAHVMVFPNRAATDTVNKVTDRLDGATTLGPVLQGFTGPVNNLPRDCTAGDIQVAALLTAAQALALRPATEPASR